MAGSVAGTDWTDRHVARWRAHWVDIHFDDGVEGIVTRIGRLQRYLKGTIQTAVAEVGIQDYEYETLHSLMIRDTPGTASPTDLADDVGVSGAGRPAAWTAWRRPGGYSALRPPTTGAGSSWRSPATGPTCGGGPWPCGAPRRRRWWRC